MVNKDEYNIPAGTPSRVRWMQGVWKNRDFRPI